MLLPRRLQWRLATHMDQRTTYATDGEASNELLNAAIGNHASYKEGKAHEARTNKDRTQQG